MHNLNLIMRKQQTNSIEDILQNKGPVFFKNGNIMKKKGRELFYTEGDWRDIKLYAMNDSGLDPGLEKNLL